MIKKWKSVILTLSTLTLSIMLSLLTQAASTAAIQEKKTESLGREDYIQTGCYECHGYHGQGASGTGPRLAPDPIEWESFAKIVRKPPAVMPPYSPKILSEERLRRIYEYLKSLPPSPDPETIPALSESQ